MDNSSRRGSGPVSRLLLGLVVGLVAVLGMTPAGVAAEKTGVIRDDVVVAIDHSGSMHASDKDEMRVKAATEVVEILGMLDKTKTSKVGVVGFGTQPEFLQLKVDGYEEQPRVLIDLRTVGEIDTGVLYEPQNTYMPGTDFHGALCLAWQTVVGRTPPAAAKCPTMNRPAPVDGLAQKSVVLITDGLPSPNGQDDLSMEDRIPVTECPANTPADLSQESGASRYFCGLAEVWRALSDVSPVDLYVAGIDMHDTWYRDSEEYWRYITGCDGEQECSERVRKVATGNIDEIVEAILRSNNISVDICQEDVDAGGVKCHIPAGMAEAAFGVDGEVSPNRIRVIGPDGAKATLKDGRWKVRAPRAGIWSVVVQIPEGLPLPVVKVVAHPADFEISLPNGPPFFVGQDTPIDVRIAGVDPTSIQQADFFLLRVHEGRDQKGHAMRLRRSSDDPPHFTVVPQPEQDQVGLWTFRVATEVPTAEGGTRTLVYPGELRVKFVRLPTESDVELDIEKVEITNWDRAQIRLVITNRGAHSVEVRPDVTVQDGTLEDIQDHPSITNPKSMTITPDRNGELLGELRCSSTTDTATVTGVVTMERAGGQPISGLTEKTVRIPCESKPNLDLSITRIGPLDWERDQYRVGVTNTESYPVKIDVSSPQLGKLGTHELQPGETWEEKLEHKCTENPFNLTTSVQILEKDGVDTSYFDVISRSEEFEDCLIQSDLVVTVGHEKADRPSEAKIWLEVANNGEDKLVVMATKWDITKGSTPKLRVEEKTVAARKTVKMAVANLTCSTDGPATVKGGINIRSVNGKPLPKPIMTEEEVAVPCAAPPPCTPSQLKAAFAPSTTELEVYSFGFTLDEQFPFRPRFRRPESQQVTVAQDSTKGLCRSEVEEVALLMFPKGSTPPPCDGSPFCGQSPSGTVSIEIPDPKVPEYVRVVRVNGTELKSEDVMLIVPWWAQHEPLWSIFVAIAAILAALGVLSAISTRAIRHQYDDYEEPARICDLNAVRQSDGMPTSLVRLGFLPWRAVELGEQYPKVYLSLAGLVAGPLVARFAGPIDAGDRVEETWELEDEASVNIGRRLKSWWRRVSRFRTLVLGRRLEENRLEIRPDEWASISLQKSLDQY